MSHGTIFNGSSGLKFDVHKVAREIVSFMMEKPQWRYKVMIGTDSMLYQGAVADFVTAIVVHRVGNGARYFWRRTEINNLHTLRDRMYKEALMSIDVAKDFVLMVQEAGAPKYDFEIHVDIGENGATKAVMQEVVGMIRANNFEVRTKPESYAASKVADKHT